MPNMPVNDNQELRNFLIRHEGLKFFPEPDPIQPKTLNTQVLGGPRRRIIGVGRNIDETGFSPDELAMLEENTFNRGGIQRDLTIEGITRDEAMILLGNDIRTRSQDIQKVIPQFSQFSPAQQAALLSLHFTTGSGGFRDFHDLIGALNEETPNFTKAKSALFDSKRFREKQVSNERVNQEGFMLETGQFAPHPMK